MRGQQEARTEPRGLSQDAAMAEQSCVRKPPITTRRSIYQSPKRLSVKLMTRVQFGATAIDVVTHT